MNRNTYVKQTTNPHIVHNLQNTNRELSTSMQVAPPEQHGAQQHQSESQMRKKKCRGNRKKQRYRKQLFSQGFDSATVSKLVDKRFSPESQQKNNTVTAKEHGVNNTVQSLNLSPMDNEPINKDNNTNYEAGTKRKRILLTPTPTKETISILDKPISQLPTTQGDSKKVKTTTTTTEPTSILDKPFSQLSISQHRVNETDTTTVATRRVPEAVKNISNKLTPNNFNNFKPHYLTISDRIFKRMLAESVENGFKLVESLNTPEKLSTVRQITEITNNLYFKNFQQKLWQEYDNISSKDNNWETKLKKRFTIQNNISQMYRPKKSYIKERHATTAKQKEQLRKELDEHFNKLLNDVKGWQPFIDSTLLCHAINECVIHSQKRLKEEFQYKTEMLQLNWNDCQLVMKFYKLKPDEKLIQLAQNIWQITADEHKTKEQQQILQQRIYLKRLPANTDKMINKLLDDSRPTLSNPFLDTDQRASFASRCSKLILQCKFNLMVVELDEFAVIAHRYDLTLTNLKQELLNLNKQNADVYTSLLLNVIEERRQAMIQRFLRMHQYKLKTFFDQAPTVANN